MKSIHFFKLIIEALVASLIYVFVFIPTSVIYALIGSFRHKTIIYKTPLNDSETCVVKDLSSPQLRSQKVRFLSTLWALDKFKVLFLSGRESSSVSDKIYTCF
jgi:hypothetical protein